MRLVVTSDTHYPVNPTNIPDGDVFIHAGDLMTTGTPDEWKENIGWLSQLKHTTKLYIPGNHDFYPMLYPGPAMQAMRSIGFTVVGYPGNTKYQTHTLPNGMTVLGLPYVKHLTNWCFNSTEYDVFSLLQTQPRCDIVVSHSPIKYILDGMYYSDRGFTGFRAYNEYRKKHNPAYWFHGHIHEQYGSLLVGNTMVYNVCMSDRFGKHANPPIVIDV